MKATKIIFAVLSAAIIFSACKRNNSDGLFPEKINKEQIIDTEVVPEMIDSFSENKTVLETAIERAGEIYSELDGRIFIDINGDDFPERIDVRNASYGRAIILYYFDPDNEKWTPLNDCYIYSVLKICCDKENNEYFFIAHWQDIGNTSYYKYDFTEYGFEQTDDFGNIKCMAGGEILPESGVFNFDTFFYYGVADGKFYTENSENGYEKILDKALSEYEIIKTVDCEKIISENGGGDIFIDEFADQPTSSEYANSPTKNEKEFITVGNMEIPIDAASVSINYNDIGPITEETFEKLSELPDLSELMINSADVIDISGIEKLTGLRSLEISTPDKVENLSKISGLKNLTVFSADYYIGDDIISLENADSLTAFIPHYISEEDMSADYFRPLYGLENLRYICVGYEEPIISEEQIHDIEENAPRINICYIL